MRGIVECAAVVIIIHFFWPVVIRHFFESLTRFAFRKCLQRTNRGWLVLLAQLGNLVSKRLLKSQRVAEFGLYRLNVATGTRATPIHFQSNCVSRWNALEDRRCQNTHERQYQTSLDWRASGAMLRTFAHVGTPVFARKLLRIAQTPM